MEPAILCKRKADTDLHPSAKKHKAEAKKPKKPKKPKPAALPMHVRLVKDPERFDARDSKQLQAGLAHLKEHGYAVLAHVADETEIRDLVGLFWDYLEEMNPAIRRRDPTTWSNKNWPGILAVGIFKYYGIGQSKVGPRPPPRWPCAILCV